ncbi:MAG: ATP-binding protein, partial [Chloroflexi bacterium]|nr:ATP-binding protein [Chloroflexota bacterium]
VEEVLREAGLAQPPRACRAVLVGTALNPAQPRRKPDGVETRTLWGELAWQLGAEAGDARGAYALVAEADVRGVSPGADTLQELFELLSPCLVLIDEWVAFARQLYGVSGLPAGSFDANLTFAQALTEAARRVRGALVVASIPASDIEVGGEAGREALARLENTFGRVEASWRPASADEGFAIVRRRLFQPLTDPALFAARDAVVEAFSQLYQTQRQEFPTGCGEAAYARRLREAYPIHPELFDRLYEDWSALERFQRTRGVLRLMAAVIHVLWERDDRSLLILPGMVPMDDRAVQDELLRYLDDPWRPIIEADVDGPQSLPLQLDRAHPNLGRYSACRRVARALYLGSAPTLRTAHRGLEERQIKLGCAQPGESVATFGDALRRLTDQATHLYVDGRRYWYALQPSVTRLAEERAQQQADDAVAEEIRRRLRAQASKRGDFAAVHVCPQGPADVADEDEARLVILPPDAPHAAKTSDSPARRRAAALLEQRGSGPRLYRNMLVFLAADQTRLKELEQAVRLYLAWTSIEADSEHLNLDAFQANQARSKRAQADETVEHRLPEAYQWLLVPVQPDPQGPVVWEERRLQGEDPLAVRASKRLRNDELLLTALAGVRLRLELDRVPLWRGDHVGLKQLWEDFARYLYLPRLRDSDVLLAAVRDGVAQLTWEQETFAYAAGYDAARGRYLGLRAGEVCSVVLDDASVVVRPAVARRQLDEAPRADSVTSAAGTVSSRIAERPTGVLEGADARRPPTSPPLTRFHGSVRLDPQRLGRDAGTIAEAVVQHLAGLLGAEVEVTLEIQARVPEGAPPQVVRTVSENCRTLRFTHFGFEAE